ncbi:type I polyketide synthase [Hyphomonas johnsonii]|uniref:Putative 3-oxoacyl-[acyl-carrier-protein] reductase n=1 Tax=Hyphomonas johnsonii MHS-2 TaxID=1280950 RepID=A0A059FUK5_9PROT|nr:type I polyketide synthase [Hyphomonas johnsonii]KCZ94292.1 putative 3-oxoacyl-[acyl-carrier-protein] reductase [Hyphomonas johnsonii MHS-2]
MTNESRRPADPIAIIGIGSIFPGRGGTTGFWRDIFQGRDLLTETPASHWLLDDYYDADPLTPDRTYGRRGGFISPLPFDPMAFGIPPNALQQTDSSQLLALIAAKNALDDIESREGCEIDRTRTSVILGVASATELTAHMAGRLQRPVWVNAMRQAGLSETDVQDITRRIEAHYIEWKESTFPGLLGNVAAGRVANRLDLGGSNYVTDAACASSLSALQAGLHELRSGDSDTVLAGGVDALNDILMYMCFSKTPALSPTGDCRPFSSDADGTMLGEGVGILALRRLEDAERDGNRIHAVIRGLGGGSDGKGTAIYTPLPSGQARAIERAYVQAGYGPESVDLVEAHGTGTKAGDKAELAGLNLVFGGKGKGEPWCAVGSVKSQIGHTKAAAGAASLIKTTQALSRKVLPPTIKIGEPADALKESECFYVNIEPRPWISADGRPRRASVSAFGFGGSNFHVALEEYTGPNAVRPPRIFPSELFLFSASKTDALVEHLEAIMHTEVAEDGFAALAQQTHEEFESDARVRAAIVADDKKDLAAKLSRLIGQIEAGTLGTAPLGAGMHVSTSPPETGKTAFMFSGQGSQYVGMGADLAMAFPAARAVWDKAAGHKAAGPLGLHRLAFPPAAFDQVEYGEQTQRLTEMQHAQPAIAAVALAQLALLERLGIDADMAGGHSFGEIMALYVARSFDADGALSVAAARGRLMAQAAKSTPGGMMAVQTDAQTIAPIVKKVANLVLANDNGPSQVVLSGPIDAIKAAEALCIEKGLKARRLPVATAFHSSIVHAAVAPFTAELASMRPRKPKLPVYANATASPYNVKVADLPAVIAGQIATPVRFREQVEAMYEAGARLFLEIGPGAIVTGLVKDVLGDRPYRAVSLDNKRANGLTQFLSAVGELSVAGHSLDLAALFADTPAPVPAPTPSKHAVYISGANHDKPYPPKNGAAGRAAPNTVPTMTIPSAPVAASTAPPTAPHPTPASPAPTPSRTLPMPDSSHTYPAAIPASSSAERIWSEVSQLHSQYLSTTAASHTAFLNAAASLLGGQPVAQAAPAPIQRIAPPPAAPAPVAQPAAPAPQAAAPVAAKPYTNGAVVPAPAPAPTPAPAAPAPAAPAPVAVAATPTPPPSDGADPVALVRSIVSDKTGYPVDMLDADMDLEGELGVDSIKQVEILSSLRERLPHLPEIDPEQLVELRTISAIAAMIGGVPAAAAAAPAPVAAAAPAAAAPAPAVSAPVAPAATNGGAITPDVIRALVADKTGYPSTMLEDDMDLEGELGVDSIKQVEILSALRDQHPSLPEVDPEVLADLRTIRKIADFFS